MTAALTGPSWDAARIAGTLLRSGTTGGNLVVDAVLGLDELLPGAADEYRREVIRRVGLLAEQWDVRQPVQDRLMDDDRLAESTFPAAVTRAEPDLASSPWWLVGSLLLIEAEWRSGELKSCLHAADVTGLTPVIVASWRSDIVVCSRCTHLIGRPGRDCDVCGARAVVASSVCSGRIVFLVLLCPVHRDEAHGAAA